MNISMDDVLRKSENLVFRKIDEEYILVPLAVSSEEVESIFSLNETGALIWEKIDGSKKVGEIIDELAVIYDGDRPTLKGDVISFIHDLIEARLLEVS